MQKLLEESSRGALLVATYHVDFYLAKLLRSKLPPEMEQTKIDKLFAFKGPFNSLSQKLISAYNFGLISKRVYDNINHLRSIRNDAAHSKHSYPVERLKEEMKVVYNFGPQFLRHFEEQAMKIMLELKLPPIIDFIKKSELSPEDQERAFFNIIADKKILEKLESQVPFWQLVYGISFICGLILHFRDSESISAEKLKEWNKLIKA